MNLFEPFKNFRFSLRECFLCGNKLEGIPQNLSVFPLWFINQFNLKGHPFRMLNESYKNYEDLQIPCCEDCREHKISPLDEEIQFSFLEGFPGMKNLDPYKLFLWVSRVMYGIIFLEIQLALEDHEKENRKGTNGISGINPEEIPLGISPSLLTKFGQVHLFLQGLRFPIVLEDFSPFSLWIIPLTEGSIMGEREAQGTIPFEYRDDMSTLIFSLTALDFGFIICLQDNGRNAYYWKKQMESWGEKPMSFKQFQEFRAKVFYSAFLFIPIPDYLILPPVASQNEFTLEAQPLPYSGSSIFKPWSNNTYAQVLEAFWKPWGIKKSEILENPERPRSELGW